MKPIKIFHIDVSGGVATYDGNAGDIVCGNSRYQAEFSFDSEWDDYAETEKIAKFIVWRNGRYESLNVAFKGNTCKIPPVYNVKQLIVGVYIEDGISTTTEAVINCRPSILCRSTKSMLTLAEIQSLNLALKGEDGKDYVLTDEDIEEIASLINGKGAKAKIGEVTLPASKWVGENNLYSQVVEIEGVTEYSQVDLTPDVQQLAIFYNKDITFVTENEDGVVTVYVIGQKPENDYTIQVTITEVGI